MKRISALFIHKIAALASDESQAGIAVKHGLLHAAGLDPKATPDPKRMVTDKTFYALFERIAREGDRAIAIRVGSTMRCDDYGAFGLAFKSALDLWGSFQRVERYGKIVTNIANFEVLPQAGGALMAVIPDRETRLGLRMTNELAVAAATALSREVSSDGFAPSAVYFAHSAPDDVAAYAAHFRCPVKFGAARDGLEIPDHSLRAQNRLGDKGLSEFFDSHLEKELGALEPESSLIHNIRTQIRRSLSEGTPSVSSIAEQFGMSRRSLQRRLSEKGYVFQEIVDSTRRDLAEHLLQTTPYSLSEIAFLTGFSEQSAFSRAFKRWRGQTPQSFRMARH